MGTLIAKAKGFVKEFISEWTTPKEGNYVPNKEIVAYSVGGMGVQFIASCTNLVPLNVSSTLIGFVYGFRPTDIALLMLINTIFTLVTQPLKSWLIDNVYSAKGKARPYLFWLGPPSAILVSLTAYIPTTWSPTVKLFTFGGLWLIMNFVFQFYYGMYTMLAQLISPNTNERAKIVSWSSIIYSFAPTITGALFPMLSLLFDRQLLDINFYRMIFPIFSFLGCGMGFLAYFLTKERVILPRNYQKKVKFMDGLKKIVANKYFWINNITSWFTFGRNALIGFMNYAYICMLQNNAIMSPLTLLAGTASLIGMVLGPIMIQKIGKRNTLILTNAVFIVAAIPLAIFNDNFWLFFFLVYIMNWTGAVQLITTPAFGADALDYQQWKTGDRLEGFSQNFGILAQLIAIGTNYIIPTITAFYGLGDNYDVLFDPAVRSPMFSALAVLSIVCAVGCTLPYFFWDLTEKKHAEMIEDLKRRAHAENVAHGDADDELVGTPAAEVAAAAPVDEAAPDGTPVEEVPDGAAEDASEGVDDLEEGGNTHEEN